MFSLGRIANLLAALSGLLPMLSGSLDTAADVPPAIDRGPAHVVVLHGDVDDRWREHIDADLARFEAAGLGSVLTDIHVWGAASDERCLGYAGVFRPNRGAPRVDICIDFHESSLGTGLRHQLVLHELAHAWIHANVSDGQRRDFVAARGAPSWNDADDAHFTRGTELAANAVMGMLHPDPPSDIGRLCGFELLTGRSSVSARVDPCAGREPTDSAGSA